MTWERRYRLKQAASTSLMLPAAFALFLAIACSAVLRALDEATAWHVFNYSPEGARLILGTFVGSLLTFIVFVLSATLIVVQLACGQFSPRAVSIIFARPGIKWTLGLLTFTFTYTLAALSRIEEHVHDFHVGVAVVLNLICILCFFYFAQQLSRQLQPYALIQHIANRGRRVIDQIYPKPYNSEKTESSGSATAGYSFDQTIAYAGHGGIIMAFSVANLMRLARESGAVIQLVPQVGDCVAPGDPLFRHTTAVRPLSAVELHGCVALGPERTLEQDPRFLFRILVDIASKALSPAINDPTTAVIALDQIDDLLLQIGRRHLGDGLVRDADGALRLVFGTPDWPDYVMLAVSEIRQFGEGSLQVVRRLRAMLEHLIAVLPDVRHLAIKAEMTMLDGAAKRKFPDAEDYLRANIADHQGIGGSIS